MVSAIGPHCATGHQDRGGSGDRPVCRPRTHQGLQGSRRGDRVIVEQPGSVTGAAQGELEPEGKTARTADVLDGPDDLDARQGGIQISEQRSGAVVRRVVDDHDPRRSMGLSQHRI